MMTQKYRTPKTLCSVWPFRCSSNNGVKFGGKSKAVLAAFRLQLQEAAIDLFVQTGVLDSS
jgi:hypothetical protein